MRPLWAVIASIHLVLATGCAGREANLKWPPRSPLGADLPAAGRAHGEAKVDPKAPLTLRRALAIALLQSPELEAFAVEVRAKEARMLQAGLVPNPTATVEAEDLLGSGGMAGVRQLQLTVWLGQLVELGGKRGARLAASREARDLAAWDYELKRVDLLTRVSQAFVSTLEAREQLALARRLAQLAGEAERAVAEQETAGSATKMQLARATLSRDLARMELRDARARLQARREELGALLGSDSFSAVTGELGLPGSVPSFFDLRRRLERSPHLSRWAAAQALARAEVRRASADAFPDVELLAGYRYSHGTRDSAAVFGLSVPLPLLSRNQGGRAEAEQSARKTAAETRGAAAKLRSRLARAHGEMVSAFERGRTLGRTVVPAAEESYRRLKDAYRIGRVGYLELLDAQRTLFAARRRYVETLGRFHRAVADVEHLLGAPMAPTRRRS
jgi:cobalt-zinc-cadmium efflux system outer membrane protein